MIDTKDPGGQHISLSPTELADRIVVPLPKPPPPPPGGADSRPLLAGTDNLWSKHEHQASGGASEDVRPESSVFIFGSAEQVPQQFGSETEVFTAIDAYQVNVDRLQSYDHLHLVEADELWSKHDSQASSGATGEVPPESATFSLALAEQVLQHFGSESEVFTAIDAHQVNLDPLQNYDHLHHLGFLIV